MLQISKLKINFVIDSELKLVEESLSFPSYASPLLCSFGTSEGTKVPTVEVMSDIQQRKGEAEMAVADWLIHLKDKFEDGAAAVSIIT